MSQYGFAQDLFAYALPQKALPADVTPSVITAAIVAASGVADSYMRARYPLPLSPNYPGPTGVANQSFDPALVEHVMYLAAHQLMTRRGFASMAGADDQIDKNRDRAVEFFRGVERGNVHLDVVVTTVTPPTYQLPQVFSHRPRGI